MCEACLNYVIFFLNPYEEVDKEGLANHDAEVILDRLTKPRDKFWYD